MILKIKHGVDWHYIDNIIKLTIEPKQPGNWTPFVYSRWHKTGVIAEEVIDCDSTVYLLSDEGKTIEVFGDPGIQE